MTPSSERRIRVLLVEDDFVHAELFQECLELSEDGRFHVRVVTDVASAVAALRDHPDIVVTDLGLPDASGPVAVERLLAAAGQIPVVVLTSREDLETCMRCIEAGAQDFIVKGRHAPEFYGRMLLQAAERKQLFEALRLRNEEIQAFSYALTHDLKSPLRTLQFLMDGLRKGARESTTTATLDRMEQTLEHMEEFIQEILLFARFGTGGSEPTDVELVALAHEVLGLLAPMAEQHGVRITVDGEAPITVRGDPSQLRHMLLNLVENGIVHGRENGGEMRIRVRGGPDAAVLEVEDNGPGVPPDHIGRIFEPFYRASASRPGAAKGHGMGLALVDRITRNHRGRVQVENLAAGGTRFRVTLPPAQRSALRSPDVLEGSR